MKILAVSDSHGRLGNMQSVVENAKPDVMLHMGDVELDVEYVKALLGIKAFFVRGNCDADFSLKSYHIFEAAGHRIFMTHGHNYGVRYGLNEIKEVARREKCDIALFGHTHVPIFEEDDGLVVANPGSIEFPRGAVMKPSFMIIEIDKDEVDFQHFYID